MNAAGGLYPSLGRYFKSLTDLAEAGCMSRQRARDCLDGKKNFTDAEKKAIAGYIAMYLRRSIQLFGPDGRKQIELENARIAWEGNFDAIYRKKVKNV